MTTRTFRSLLLCAISFLKNGIESAHNAHVVWTTMMSAGLENVNSQGFERDAQGNLTVRRWCFEESKRSDRQNPYSPDVDGVCKQTAAAEHTIVA